MKFDHIGLVVKKIARGRTFLEASLGVSDWTGEIRDELNGVIAQFGRDPSGLVYELLEPLGPDSPIGNALSSRRAILNHVAYRVHDLAAAADQLRDQGCAPVAPARPGIAFGGRPIQFFVTPLHFVLELIEGEEGPLFLSRADSLKAIDTGS